MEMEEIKYLEEKVNEAVNLVQRFRNENMELKQENQRLSEETNRLKQDLDDQMKVQEELELYREKENKFVEKETYVRDKVQELIRKLDGLEHLTDREPF